MEAKSGGSKQGEILGEYYGNLGKVMVAQTRTVRSRILNIFEGRANKGFLTNWEKVMGEKQSQMPLGFLF